jgi:demethylmenaquinone methyltransferase/2-methoxy-6-polyprenyl-1,4-benzoquinol methylase
VNPRIIDVATGTGDFAIAASKLHPTGIIAIDISENMLVIGRKKVDSLGLSDIISFQNCDSENICFDDSTFDVATVAFGVRNFSDPVRGLSEMNRVLRKGGLAVVLEFSKPDVSPFKQIYNFYFRNLLPLIGKTFSSDRSAYRYLNESVMKFADNEEFMSMMEKAGFSEITQRKLTCGVVSIYSGFKE